MRIASATARRAGRRALAVGAVPLEAATGCGRPLFPGFFAGASLKRVMIARAIADSACALPRLFCRGLIEAYVSIGDRCRRFLFPGFFAGASLKR